ncbi:MAG: hypothetical protein ACTSRU_00695 [Candidatus Hodarchaeales archaeon]
MATVTKNIASINFRRFIEELKASSFSAKYVTIEKYFYDGADVGDIIIELTSALTGPEDADLDAIILAHDPTPDPAIPDYAGLENRIIVNQENVATTLGGIIDSSKEYFLDGVIDMSGVTVEVPAGGINIKGFDFDVSKMICSDPNYTMFTSAVGGSGNVLGIDYAIEVTGSSSKVYALESATGFDAFEFSRINYNNCSSLGYIDGYRQGLESGTGRFGGSPSLEFRGSWNGFRVTTSIVRVLSASMTEPLFKAGAGFLMSNRFLTDINCDLPTSAAFCDFSAANFSNPSTLQVHGAIFTRNGTSNAEDTNIFSNIAKSELPSDFKRNQGVSNTFVGGVNTVTGEIQTIISSSGTFETMDGTFTPSDMEHFDSPSNGKLRHLGNNPREFRVVADLTVDGNPDRELTARVKRWDDSSSSFITVFDQRRQVNSLVRGRDVAFFSIYTHVTLDKNDYVFLEVANNTDSTNVTLEASSFLDIEQR